MSTALSGRPRAVCCLRPMAMRAASLERLKREIVADDLVLDVGGWIQPFTRADWVIDLMPYETRGRLGTQGDGDERFGPDTWVERDICHHEPWPFEDKQFDFVTCAHTLEDVRDPTGAGDSFAGGFLGLLDRLDANDAAALRQATVMGSTIASFTVEQFSLDRLRDLDLSQVRRRFDAFRQLVHFDELPEHIG